MVVSLGAFLPEPCLRFDVLVEAVDVSVAEEMDVAGEVDVSVVLDVAEEVDVLVVSDAAGEVHVSVAFSLSEEFLLALRGPPFVGDDGLGFFLALAGLRGDVFMIRMICLG